MPHTKEQRKAYLLKNKEVITKKKKEYYEQNKEYLKSKARQYQNENKEKLRIKERKKYSENPLFRLKVRTKNMIGKALKESSFQKLSKTEQILGCTYNEFKTHLETQFESWMSWDNYGLYNGESNYGWDIDHIIPLKTATCEADIIRLNHYTNLQPLCSYYNRIIKRGRCTQ